MRKTKVAEEAKELARANFEKAAAALNEAEKVRDLTVLAREKATAAEFKACTEYSQREHNLIRATREYRKTF